MLAVAPRPRTLVFALVAILALTGCASTRDRRAPYLHLIRPDQRPPVVAAFAAADSLFGVAAKSTRCDGFDDERRSHLERIVRRFAPTLVLPRGDAITKAGRTYQLLPTDPRVFGDTLRIDRIAAAPYGHSSSSAVALRTASPAALARLVESTREYQSRPDEIEVWYFDFPGGSPREWWDAYARLRSGPDSAAWSTPTVYAHPSVEESGRLLLQYWYFYPFNDYLANHEGDWEHVNVVISAAGDSIEEVHYFFHGRSVRLPQRDYRPERVDQTHPVVHVGGRANALLNTPMRLLSGDRNSGSHGNYPYPGEWEGAAGLGHTESVSGAGGDSARVIPYDRFQILLTPEPSRVDYRRDPEVLRDWVWLLLPARWGYPSAPSLGGALRMTDVGNRAPFGPAFNSGWNRTAPGIGYPAFSVRRVPRVQSYLEDLVQPWYYLYAFRHPRFVHDSRGMLERRELERLGLAPRSGWAERGMGSPVLGAHVAIPRGRFADRYRSSIGFLLWRNFWLAGRVGGLEVTAGYQRFRRDTDGAGTLFIYPVTGQLLLRGPEGRVRPYASVGLGAYGWESRLRISGTDSQLVKSGWGLGKNAAVGVEYYLRPKLALNVSLRFHDAIGPGAEAGIDERRLRFVTLWVGHYLRL